MLDETFSEAYRLLDILLSEYGKSRLSRPVEVAPYAPPSTNEADGSHHLGTSSGLFFRGDHSLSDISIDVNRLRVSHPRTPFIHRELPEMIIKNKPEDILRLLSSWERSIHEAGTVEFYILPKETFTEIEKKMLSIVDGAIELRMMPTETGSTLTLLPVRISKPEWHLRPLPYKIEEDRLLIKWEGEFTDELVKISDEEITLRVEGYGKNLDTLAVRAGIKTPTGLSLAELALYSAIKDRDLLSINLSFPEKFQEIVRKIARWHIQGFLAIEKLRHPNIKPSELHVGRKTSLPTRLVLRTPDQLTRPLFSLMTGGIRKLPVDLYLASRKASTLILSRLLEEDEPRLNHSIRQMIELEKRVGQAAIREAVVEHLRKLGEDVTGSLERRFIPKLLTLAISSAFGLVPTVTKTSDTEYQVSVEDCFVCEDIRSSKPVCALMEGCIEGLIAIVFKIQNTCEEVQCKALNDPTCTFRLTLS